MSGTESPRPRDLALLLLAAESGPPRARAREQQSDRAGEATKHEILRELAVLDPEPDALSPALEAIVTRLGEPSGPARALALLLLQEWEAVQAQPSCWEWHLSEAIGRSSPPRSQSRGASDLLRGGA